MSNNYNEITTTDKDSIQDSEELTYFLESCCDTETVYLINKKDVEEAGELLDQETKADLLARMKANGDEYLEIL